ncbi:hypothetical protein HPP92_024864 [Vanilla planifolia]|uniref:Uncharacterized protein n=1 Tax=Vanilla planifolia TaxID=51239 RepID=A0A835UBK1_VANPL|nr:hypothetical protein HPP92_024864 [Vanilla planifolia]
MRPVVWRRPGGDRPERKAGSKGAPTKFGEDKLHELYLEERKRGVLGAQLCWPEKRTLLGSPLEEEESGRRAGGIGERK